jgi:hypothetical protein
VQHHRSLLSSVDSSEHSQFSQLFIRPGNVDMKFSSGSLTSKFDMIGQLQFLLPAYWLCPKGKPYKSRSTRGLNLHGKLHHATASV